MSYCDTICTGHMQKHKEHMWKTWNSCTLQGRTDTQEHTGMYEDIMANKNSVIYSYSCGRIDCIEEYIGESGKTYDERFKEHLKTPYLIFGHQKQWP